ncbi:hypothetical protein KM043_015249 [Ampulex compressa]|nr:hypothetical protein KM043_015249 [Ampulex compressa]
MAKMRVQLRVGTVDKERQRVRGVCAPEVNQGKRGKACIVKGKPLLEMEIDGGEVRENNEEEGTGDAYLFGKAWQSTFLVKDIPLSERDVALEQRFPNFFLAQLISVIFILLLRDPLTFNWPMRRIYSYFGSSTGKKEKSPKTKYLGSRGFFRRPGILLP